MGRRTSLASLAGGPVEDVPGQNDVTLLRLPLSQLVPTRFNPRRNFGTEEQLKEFGEVLKKRQLQPAVIVSRGAYLKLWPDEADNVGDRPYVIANGERRWRAHQAAGLTHIYTVQREEVAATRADFLDAVLSENNDREDLDPIERAIGIETMVAEIGGSQAVADHYGKTKGWVSQQRKLLKLTDDLQGLVSAGEMPVRVARDIAGLPASEQAAAWASEVKQREVVKATPRQRTKPAPPQQRTINSEQGPSAPPGGASLFTAVNTPEEKRPAIELGGGAGPAREKGAGGSFTAVNGSEPERADEGKVVDDRPTSVVLPWDDPSAVLQILRQYMRPENIAQLVKEATELV